ncbi:MAG: efflux RND transporter periplasmic adaptor subunit [Candidatus Zixiibacteriota bacterium]
MSPQDEHFEEPHSPLPEGEEAPPPHVKKMAIVRWVLLGGLSLFALIMVLGAFGLTPWSSESGGSTQYHCPMHPTYVSNQPGDCPICGMSLVPIDQSGAESRKQETSTEVSVSVTAQPGQYTCPMHPEVISDTMGQCPKCGMNLEQVPKAKPGQYVCPMHPEVISDTAGRCPKCNMFLEQVAIESQSYTCPMHPEVVSDNPGACPKCGMDLVKKEETSSLPSSSSATDAPAEHAAMSNVPGLASVTIEPNRLQLIGLRTSRAEQLVIGSSLPMVGYVATNEKTMSAVSLRSSGWVNKLYVNTTGQRIQKGAPLVELYSPEIAQAWREYESARESSQKSAVDPQLSAVRTDMLATAKLRLAQLGLSQEELSGSTFDEASSTITLRSPATGTVIEKNVVEGQYSSSNQPLFVIADLSTIWVVADVYESDIAHIKAGQSASVTFSSLSNVVFTGQVSFVSPVVSEETRTAQARVVLDNPSGQLRPGMYAEIKVQEDSRATLAVPSEAVLDGGAEQYLFVVHDRTHFEPRLVTVGVRDDSHTEILSGLKSGEEVVTSANFLIDSESRLKAAIAGMGQVTESHTGHGR